MKRGIVIVGILLLLSLGLVGAKTCENLNALSCGTTPNSAIGYGAVDICNNCYVCGEADGICPEDFYSTSSETRGSCRNCPDPDCTATVSGYVFTPENKAIGADVYVVYGTGQKWIAKTDNNGHYVAPASAAGNVKFHASYQDYDTEIVSARIIRGSSNTEVNISVSPGACNSECTDTFGNICKAKCNGVNGCVFTDASAFGYSSSDIASRCDGYSPGTKFPINESGEEITYANCCNKPLTTEKRPILDLLDKSENENIKNLGTSTIKAKYKGYNVLIVVKSWETVSGR